MRIILIVIVFLLVKFKQAIQLGLAYILSSLTAQFLKHSFFSDALRPRKFFEGIHELYFVPGVEVYSFNSFPSGHACNAFALFFCLALISTNNFVKFLCLLMALVISLSRVYLSQHFFMDIYVGSIIGVLSSLAAYYFLGTSSRLKGKVWMEKSLLGNA